MEDERNIGTAENAAETVAPAGVTEDAAIGVVGEAPKKKSKGLIAAIVAIIAVIAIGAGVITSFGSSEKQVMSALEKTFNLEGTVLGDMLNSKLLKAEQATATMTMEMQGMNLAMDVTADNAAKQSAMNLKLEFMGIKADADLYMNDQEVQAKVPMLSDKVITYNFLEEKNGYLGEMLESMELSYEDVDEILKSSYQPAADTAALEAKLAEVTKSRISGLTFEKVDAKEFEVNGAAVSCKGHKTTITESYMEDWIKDYQDAMLSFYEGLSAENPIYEMQFQQYKDMFDQLLDNFGKEDEEESSVDITFYVDGGLLGANGLAAIILSDGESTETIEIDFKGGAYALQNGALLVKDGDEVESEFTWTGTTEGTKSTFTLKADGEEICTLSYDTENGAYEAKLPDGSSIKGTFILNDELFKMTIDEVKDSEFNAEFKFNMEMTAGAKEMKPLTGNGTFDIGNADEAAFDDFYNEAMMNLANDPQLGALLMGL